MNNKEKSSFNIYDEEFEVLYQDIFEDFTSMSNYMVINLLNSIKIAYHNYSKLGALYNLECLYYMLYYTNFDVIEGSSETFNIFRNRLILSKHADFDSIFHELGHAIHYNLFNIKIPNSFKNNITDFKKNNEDKIDEITLKLLECINYYNIIDQDNKLSICSINLISDLLSGLFYLNKNSFYYKYYFYHRYDYFQTEDGKLDIKTLYMEIFAHYNTYFIRNGNITFPFLEKFNGNNIIKDVECLYYSKMKQKYRLLLSKKGVDFLKVNEIQNSINEPYEEKLRRIEHMNNAFFKRIKKEYGNDTMDYVINKRNHPGNSMEDSQLKKLSINDIILLYSYNEDIFKQLEIDKKPNNKYEKDKEKIIHYYFNTSNFNYYILDYYLNNRNNNMFSDGDLLYYIQKYYKGNKNLIKQIIEEKLLYVKNKDELFKIKENYTKKFDYSLQALYEDNNVFIDYYGIKYYINSSISQQSYKVKGIVEKIHNKIDNCGISNNPIKEVFITKNNDLIEEKYEESNYYHKIVIKYSNT